MPLKGKKSQHVLTKLTDRTNPYILISLWEITAEATPLSSHLASIELKYLEHPQVTQQGMSSW